MIGGVDLLAYGGVVGGRGFFVWWWCFSCLDFASSVSGAGFRIAQVVEPLFLKAS